MKCSSVPWFYLDEWQDLLKRDGELWTGAMEFYRKLAAKGEGMQCHSPCPPFHKICVKSCAAKPWYEMPRWEERISTDKKFRAEALKYFKERENRELEFAK
jgi:hypothetical protein